jgi:hypothetical protein
VVAIKDPIRDKAAKPAIAVLVIVFRIGELLKGNSSPINAVKREEFPSLGAGEEVASLERVRARAKTTPRYL